MIISGEIYFCLLIWHGGRLEDDSTGGLVYSSSCRVRPEIVTKTGWFAWQPQLEYLTSPGPTGFVLVLAPPLEFSTDEVRTRQGLGVCRTIHKSRYLTARLPSFSSSFDQFPNSSICKKATLIAKTPCAFSFRFLLKFHPNKIRRTVNR